MNTRRGGKMLWQFLSLFHFGVIMSAKYSALCLPAFSMSMGSKAIKTYIHIKYIHLKYMFLHQIVSFSKRIIENETKSII